MRPRAKSYQQDKADVLMAVTKNPIATLREIEKLTGIRRSSVNKHLRNLQDEGLVNRDGIRRGRRTPAQRMSQHGYQSEETCEKKSKAASANRAGDAFRTHTSKSKRNVEQERIDMVVRMVKEKEAAGIITDSVNVFDDHRVRRVLGRRTG